jgi:hypothetical protein
VNDATDPVKYSVLVFRDPDNIQLELFLFNPDGKELAELLGTDPHNRP